MPKALTIKQIEGKPGQVYYPLQIIDHPTPVPKHGEVLVKIHAAALNHRDLFIRQALYPGISFSAPLLADGCGTIISRASGASSASPLRVIINPGNGWAEDVKGPEKAYSVVGGSKFVNYGMGAEEVVVGEREVEVCPEHLSDVEAAALPLTGLTGWRALVTKGEVKRGDNVLVTGIGGGVALMVLQFAVAMGARVWVTSGSEEKIQKAKELGAQGGVIYKTKEWEKELSNMLPKDRPYFDAVVDGAGGDIVSKSVKLLKNGGIISIYGMTISPKMDWSMAAVMKNIELRGSTMGSRQEFAAMVQFVRSKKIKPVVSRVVKGLDNLADIDGLFEDMKSGRQFGKLVIEVVPGGKEIESKL